MLSVPDRSSFSYRCKYCGYEAYSEKSASGLSKTATGNYGDNATPLPELFAEDFLTDTTIAFSTSGGRETEAEESLYMENGTGRTLEDPGVGTITDSLFRFRDVRFHDAMLIRIESDSSTNDGDYKIANRGVLRGEILLESSLAPEIATTAGEVSLSRLLYQPNVTTGCPFCGSLNSK